MIVDGVERRVFAEELAVEAGQLAVSYRAREDLDVRSKGLLDWVTKADLATEQLIRRRIGESFPHDRILGEEEGVDAPRTGAGHVRESGGWSTDLDDRFADDQQAGAGGKPGQRRCTLGSGRRPAGGMEPPRTARQSVNTVIPFNGSISR